MWTFVWTPSSFVPSNPNIVQISGNKINLFLRRRAVKVASFRFTIGLCLSPSYFIWRFGTNSIGRNCSGGAGGGTLVDILAGTIFPFVSCIAWVFTVKTWTWKIKIYKFRLKRRFFIIITCAICPFFVVVVARCGRAPEIATVFNVCTSCICDTIILKRISTYIFGDFYTKIFLSVKNFLHQIFAFFHQFIFPPKSLRFYTNFWWVKKQRQCIATYNEWKMAWCTIWISTISCAFYKIQKN